MKPLSIWNAAVIASLGLAAGCGLDPASPSNAGTEGANTPGTIHVANLKVSNVTDTKAHVSCAIEPPGVEDPNIEYIYGVAGADGMPMEPTLSTSSTGGFVDLVNLAPDTEYAVKVIATRGGLKADATPVITMHTREGTDAEKQFQLWVLPGSYVYEQRPGERTWVGMVQVDPAACASGIGVTGLHDAGSMLTYEWLCMDFATMSASTRLNGIEARAQFDMCDCSAIATDFGASYRPQCEARLKSPAACGDHNASAGKHGVSIHLEETAPGGLVMHDAMFLKELGLR